MRWVDRRDDMVTLTHIPTGIRASVSVGLRRNMRDTIRAAKSLLAARIWGRDKPKQQKVRSWHLDPYLGVAPYIKDERTGKLTPYSREMLNPCVDKGESFERILREWLLQ